MVSFRVIVADVSRPYSTFTVFEYSNGRNDRFRHWLMFFRHRVFVIKTYRYYVYVCDVAHRAMASHWIGYNSRATNGAWLCCRWFGGHFGGQHPITRQCLRRPVGFLCPAAMWHAHIFQLDAVDRYESIFAPEISGEKGKNGQFCAENIHRF